MEVVILGTKYKKLEKQPSKSFSPAARKLLMMTMMFPFSMQPPVSSRRSTSPKVNIVSEYELILQKKSNLSRRQREWVVRQFESNFIKMEE